MNTIEKTSPCKVNLLLNILCKRADGFHELETVMQPVNLFDRLCFKREGNTLRLTCNQPDLPVDSSNLVYRSARSFLDTARIRDGIHVHLEKHIPIAAGLGGGSGNAATTLLAMNEIFGKPLEPGKLLELAASLGSDVPFFLTNLPALATGRGENVKTLEPFPALRGLALLLIHPGFGIATAWAYKELARYPDALNGRPGRAQELIRFLQESDPTAAGNAFYNSLEAPALGKYPVLALYQSFLREQGAIATLMSGSGSTTFALVDSCQTGQAMAQQFQRKFGESSWVAVVEI